MTQRLSIIIFAILAAVVLVGLNAASYTQKPKEAESESAPNRSSFNPGPTGTQAFYTLLFETGRKVVRWQEPPSKLINSRSETPAIFIVIGSIKREFSAPEIEELLRWVSLGGRLVLIDREAVAGLMTTTANWKLSTQSSESGEIYVVDPADQGQMTFNTAAVRPIQPTVLTKSVNAIQPSQFAASIGFERFAETETANPPPKTISDIDQDVEDFATPQRPDADGTSANSESELTEPPPDTLALPDTSEVAGPPNLIAPTVHFADNNKNLVVEVPFGSGKIVFLSDPYIVSNGGISLADNAQLALNLVAGDQVIAFDEFHQGFGADSNRFLQFFSGTPVVAIFLQALLVIGFVFYSQSRRFARAVPEPEPDRLTKLEYVAAMSDLQMRTKAFDLAIENIYGDFRRRAARYFGLDNFTAKSTEIAALCAERGGLDRIKTEKILHQCEEIIRGEPTTRREVVRLAGELRDIEQSLGMTRAVRTRI